MSYSEEQARRFDRILQPLLEFTNAHLASCSFFQAPIQSAEDVIRAFRISLDLWQDPSMIDLYLELTAKDLDDSTRETISSWRHALRGPFYVKEASGQTALLLYEGTLFEAHSLNRSWNSMIPYQPDFIYTTLIPYEGKIILDGFLQHHQSAMLGPGKERLNTEYAEAKRGGIVATAEEFAPVADKLNRARKTGALDANAAMVWIDCIASLNAMCSNSCFPYDIPPEEIPSTLRESLAQGAIIDLSGPPQMRNQTKASRLSRMGFDPRARTGARKR